MAHTHGRVSDQTSSMRLRHVLRFVCIALVLVLVSTPGGAGAADSGAGSLDVRDAHIEGSGPWTALFGAPSPRTLVVTVANTGVDAIDVPAMVLAFGRAANPDRPLTSPAIGRLAPGATATVRVAVTLPRFAIGTYAVTGTFAGTEPSIGFRAETSHIPWALVLAPALVLAQLALVALRNRVRRRIHGTAPSPQAPPPEPVSIKPASTHPVGVPPGPTDDLERIIAEELSIVFDAPAAAAVDAAVGNERTRMVRDLAAATAARVADRVEIDRATRDLLDQEITGAVLEALGLVDT